MKRQNDIKVFEDKQVRSVWDNVQEKWYISIVDVIAVLTESVDPTAYWRKLKQRIKEEGNETVAKVARKELEAKTGKNVVTSLNAKAALQLNECDKKKPKKNK